MKFFGILVVFLGLSVSGWATVWNYDFGTGTGSHTSATASTVFLPTPTSGTARVRVGTNPGSIAMVNPGLAGLGSNTELQITSNTGSTSTTKFSIYDYTASKEGYVKFKIAFSGGTNGVYKFSLGDGTNYSDNNAIGSNQIFAGIEWTLGATNTISYKVLNASAYGTTGISNPTTLFVQSTSTVYQVEVYSNNTTAPISYYRSGTSYSLTNATWDLWVDGTRVGTGLAKGGIATNTNFDSFSINHQTSASAPGTLYIDDIEYSNVLPLAPSNSSASDIIANALFTYPTNIDYSSYQGTTPLTTSNSIEVGQFYIQDGGGAADADLLATTLTALTLNVTNPGSLRRIALFDGSTNLGEVAAGATASFTGLTLAASDGGSKTLSVRASFLSNVTDNQQFSFTVSSATASGVGSGFAAANAGGAATSTTSDANRIEVTASDIIFVQNTSVVSLGAVMSPSPTIRAIDANLNYDLDYTGVYSVAVSTGSATLDATATTSGNFSAGVVTLNNLKFDGAGTANNITVTSGSFTEISSAFDVTNPQPEINIKQAATSIATGGSYDFGSQLSGSSSSVITFTVENLGTADLSLSGNPKVTISGTNASEFTIDQTTTSATVSASGTTTFTITFSPTSQGSKTASISIANNDGTGSENPYVINLTGTGTVSAASDIANTSGYSYTSNIAYASYQTATTLTTGNSVGATGITVRDGAGTTDADNLGTTLTAISFTTGGSTAIRTAALFDGSTNVSEVAVNGGTTISFTGLSLSAADNGTKELELRVTYLATVTDNQQITFTVSAATASTNGSGFAAANAGGVASSTTSNINRIEVTATQLAFVQQPTNSVIGGNTTPAVTVKAIDANSITDLDFTANVDITSTGTLSSSPQTSAGVAGIATFSSVSHSATGTGLKLTAASSGLTSVESATFNVTVQAAGELLLEENFNYTGLLTANGYSALSGTGTNNLTAGSTGLIYSNYGSSNIGNALSVANTGQDVTKTFNLQSSPTTIYASFLVNISASFSGGDYVFAFAPSAGSTNYRARVFVKSSSNSGNVNFGIANAGTATYGATDFALNTTHLVVVKYQFTSATTATATVFVNPNLSSESGTSEITVTDNAAANAPADITSFAIRQGSATSAPTFVMDGLRIATNWGSLMGNASFDSNANIAAGNYNSINVMNGSTLTQTGNVTASGLTIGSGSTVTINAGKQLTISGALTNSAGNSGFVLKSDATGTATLINSTAGVNATVEQYLPQGRNWYVGLPVISGSASTLTAAGLGTSVSYWNEAGSAWVNSFTGSLTPGLGYIAVSNAGTGTNNTSFAGTLNSGDVTVMLTKKGASKTGFNLVANPYPSYIDAVALVGANVNMDQTVWYRTKVGAAYHFPTVNTTSGVVTDASGATSSVTRLIPPMQAFWVRTNTDNNDLVFTNAIRYHANATVGGSPVTTTPMKVQQSSNDMLVRINVSNGENQDQMLIYTNDNANNDFDIYDSRKMMNDNVNIPDLYSVVGSEKLVINGLKTIMPDKEIELGFAPGKSGLFSINATELKNIPSDMYVAIKDNNQKAEFNLTSGQSYEFSSDAVNDANRFSIILRSSGTVNGLDNKKLNASTSMFVNANGELVVKTSAPLSADASVAIFNAIGQQISSQPITAGMSISNVSRTAGVYWVKLTSDGESITRKVIIK